MWRICAVSRFHQILWGFAGPGLTTGDDGKCCPSSNISRYFNHWYYMQVMRCYKTGDINFFFNSTLHQLLNSIHCILRTKQCTLIPRDRNAAIIRNQSTIEQEYDLSAHRILHKAMSRRSSVPCDCDIRYSSPLIFRMTSVSHWQPSANQNPGTNLPFETKASNRRAWILPCHVLGCEGFQAAWNQAVVSSLCSEPESEM